MSLLLTWLCCIALGFAQPWTWPEEGDSGAIDAGHLVLVELRCPSIVRPDQPELAARFLSRDGERRSTAGWRPDADPRPGFVRVEVPALWLGGEGCTATITTGDRVEERALPAASEAPRQVRLTVPAGATGVRALRFTEGEGHDGFAFAPAVKGVATLPLGAGRWTATVTGPPGDATALVELPPTATEASFRPATAPRARPPRPRHGLVVALGLVPVTLLILGGAALGAWRARRARGLGAATLAALALATLALSGVLPHPTDSLLMAGPHYTDPPNSAALLQALTDSLPRLSDVSAAFQYPEGHSWLVVGPSWLGYLPALPVTWTVNGIAGHDFGVFLGVVLLFLAAWGLARQVGVAPLPALLAGFGAVLAPCLWGELSALSLDRVTLFTVPLFLLLLERAAGDEDRRWSLAAGLSLAAVFYGQVYYGVYLALACPLLVLSRLVGPAPTRRLGRLFLIAAVALAALAPGVWALRQGTADTVYAEGPATLSAQLAADGSDLLHPVADADVERFIAAHDRRGGDNLDRPTDTPRDRLLVAVTNSISGTELLIPTATLAGRGGYWLLALAALLVLPRRRRGPAARLLLDTLILLVFALGPLLRYRDGSVGSVLPYYAAFLAVPGMDQLKHPDRFALLAASISSVPLALGLDALLQRLRLLRPGGGTAPPRRLLAGLLVGLAALLLGTLTLRGDDDPPGFLSLDTRRWLHRQYLDLALPLPVATRFPAGPALLGLPPGPALFLPVTSPTPEAEYLPALQAHLPMVNEPPHGQTRGGGLVSWPEDNALLNRAAWLAGTDRPRRILEPGEGSRARADLRAHGLRYLVLIRESLAGPELLPSLQAWMDANFQRIADDDRAIVWSVEAPAADPGATVAP